MFFQGTSSAQTWVRPREARVASPHPGWSQLPQTFPQLPHSSRHPDIDEFTVPGLGPHKDPHQPLLGLPRQQEGSRSAGTCCPLVLPDHPKFTPGSPALLKPSPHPGRVPFSLLSPTSPSKPVVPILGYTANHLGHLLKNPSAQVAHRTNSIRMSGARSQASAFEKNPK